MIEKQKPGFSIGDYLPNTKTDDDVLLDFLKKEVEKVRPPYSQYDYTLEKYLTKKINEIYKRKETKKC